MGIADSLRLAVGGSRFRRLLLLSSVVFAASALGVYIYLVYSPTLVIIASGSMAPYLNPGDLAVVVRVDPGEIGVGDVVTFRVEIPFMGERLVTHRVVSVIAVNGSYFFETKGDSNINRDSWRIPAEQVLGRVALVVPYLGYVLIYIRSLLVPVASLVAGVLIIYMSLSASPTDLRRGDDSQRYVVDLGFLSEYGGSPDFYGGIGDLNDLLIKIDIAKSLIGRDNTYAYRLLEDVSRYIESRIVEEDLKRLFRSGFRRASN